MPRKQLAELLKQLQKEIDAQESLGAEDRARLARLNSEIGRLLADEQDADTDESSDLAGAIQRGIDRFERSHPTVTLLLGRIMDTLTKMGI